MPTALDLCTTSAKKLGAIQAGETLTAANATDCLAALNSMLDSFSLDRLFVYQVVQNSYAWAADTASRTIGTGGNFSATRPTKIEEGTFFRDSSNQDFPVAITEDRAVYDRICVKSTGSTYPELLFYSSGYPLGILYAYPRPSEALTLYLNSWQTLQSFSALTTDLSLPPGWQHMIEHNLAVELEPVFNLPCPDSVKRIAIESRTRIKRINAPSMLANLDPGLIGSGGRSNIETGE